VQCAVAAPAAAEPDSDVAQVADDVSVSSDKISDSWKMENLFPPPALFQPLKYHSLHIFVSCF